MADKDQRPPVIETRATDGYGVPELWRRVVAHQEQLAESGALEERRRDEPAARGLRAGLRARRAAPAAPGRAARRAAPRCSTTSASAASTRSTAVAQILERVYELGGEQLGCRAWSRSTTSAPRASCSRGVVIETPVFYSRTFSQLDRRRGPPQGREPAAHRLLQDPRRLQPALAQLTPRSASRGVVASSAGNHAQGVALAATMLEIPSRIYMPMDAPLAKQLGHASSTAPRSCSRARASTTPRPRPGATPNGARFISAFDDEAIVAGQGTLGLELLDELPDVDTVLVPLGGGGLLAGVATAIKAAAPADPGDRRPGRGLRPVPRLARGDGAPTTARGVQTIADGIAVKRPGERHLPRSSSALVDDVVSVSDEEICQAIVLLLERAKLLVEGAGAVSLAALLVGQGRRARAEGGVRPLGRQPRRRTCSPPSCAHGLTVNGRYMVRAHQDPRPAGIAAQAARPAGPGPHQPDRRRAPPRGDGRRGHRRRGRAHGRDARRGARPRGARDPRALGYEAERVR